MLEQRTIALFGPGVFQNLTLRWSPDDPAAVSLEFPELGDDATWIISRCLLWQGLSASVGEGDVHLTPMPEEGNLRFNLSSPFGACAFDVSAKDTDEFIASTYQEMNEEAESGVIESEMDEWLATL